MKAAITQPNYLPWIGYFEMLDQVDKWISLDNVQIVKRSYHVRNKVVKLNAQPTWLTIKIQNSSRQTQFIDTRIDHSFVNEHLNKIEDYYRGCNYYNDSINFFKSILPCRNDEKNISIYNTRIIKNICEYIGIQIEISFASEHKVKKGISPNNRILFLCQENNVNHYYNAKKGIEEGLYNVDEFSNKGITIYKQEYIHPNYHQPHKEFIPYLSIVDLLFNEGSQESLSIIRGGSNWKNISNEN